MATQLNKKITRKLRFTTDRRNRPLTVSLDIDETIVFRQKGSKTTFELPLAYVYHKAMEKHLLDKYKDKLKKYKENKRNGKRAVKPTPPIKLTNF